MVVADSVLVAVGASAGGGTTEGEACGESATVDIVNSEGGCQMQKSSTAGGSENS